VKIFLIEPKRSKNTYYLSPLGLLKLAAYHEGRGDFVRLVSGF